MVGQGGQGWIIDQRREWVPLKPQKLPLDRMRRTMAQFWCSRTCPCLQLNGKRQAARPRSAAPATVKQASRYCVTNRLFTPLCHCMGR